MDPKYLLIEDFMCHRRTEVDCTAFESALIVGQNKNDPRESNGTGKTTIYYAIDFALFGVYPSDTIDEIIRDGCEECRITFDFEISNKDYRVVRSRRKKRSYLELYERVGAEWESISQKTATETKHELSKIVKIGYNAFKNSVLFAQFDLNGLASNNVGDRLNTLKEALGLMVYKNFEKIGKENLKEIRDKIKIQEPIVSALGYPKIDIENYNNELDDAKNKVDLKNKDRENRENDIIEKQTELSELKRLSSSSDAQDKLSEVNSQIKVLKTKISSLKCEKANKERDVKVSQNSINQKNKELIDIKKKIDQLGVLSFRLEEDIKEEISSVSDNIINGKSLIRSLCAKQDELSTPLPDGDKCPHCRQDMTEDHKKACLDKIDEELDQVKSEIEINTKRLGAVNNKKSCLDEELRKAIKSNKEKDNLNQRKTSKEKEIDSEERYLKQLVMIEKSTSSDLKEKIKQLEGLEEKQNIFKASCDEFSPDEISKNINNLKNDIANLKAESEQLLRDISSTNTLIGILTEKIDSRKEDLKTLEDEQKKLDGLKEDLKTYQVVVRGFSSKGIPTMVIHTILDDLQIETNKFLSDLKPGLELQFVVIKESEEEGDDDKEDTLDIKFFVHGKERSYKVLSGGQKFLFAVSLKLGLSMVIQRKLGIEIKFIELDEVDQSLDLAAVDTYADVIKKLQAYFKVFVITHNEDLKDKFTHAILVEGDEMNGATSRLVTSWD